MLYLGISRHASFSEGRVTDDAAIFSAVCALIQDAGYDVVQIPESVLVTDGLPADLTIDGIFHMARSEQALSLIEAYSQQGIPVFNAPKAVRNCLRAGLYGLLTEAGIPMPQSLVTETGTETVWNTFPCWVKGQGVRYVQNGPELEQSINAECQNAGNGAKVLLQSHVPGIIVKFYGVADTFFSCRQVTDAAQGRFGQEQHNDLTPASFSRDALRGIALKAAECAGLTIYGGDAIVTPQGQILVIDLNDWPSFRSCREEAAMAISELIMKQ